MNKNELIARNTKYLKEVRQEADHDVCVIDFENISHE